MSESIGSKVRAAQVVLDGFFDAKSCKEAGAILDVVFKLLADAKEVFCSENSNFPSRIKRDEKDVSGNFIDIPK
jgi:hypothetical protein